LAYVSGEVRLVVNCRTSVRPFKLREGLALDVTDAQGAPHFDEGSFAMIATTRLLGATLLERIGNTPLLRLDRLTAHLPGIQVLGKAEWANPGGSVKDRPAASIVLDSERRGLLKFGQSNSSATAAD